MPLLPHLVNSSGAARTVHPVYRHVFFGGQIRPVVYVEADDDVFFFQVAVDAVIRPDVFFHFAAVHAGVAGEVQHYGFAYFAGVRQAFFQ